MGTYSDFLRDKGECFQNTVKAFPQIWEALELLDAIWSRELDDFHTVGDQPVLPLLLFFEAHSRVRISVELGFSRCFSESWAVLRSGIESVVFASHILQNPRVLRTWSSKQSELAKLRAFKRVFEKARKQGLSSASKNSLKPLHQYWVRFSGFGSHTSFRSLAMRLTREPSENMNAINFNYLEVTREVAHASLVDLLACSYAMERTLFMGLRSRLDLDTTLADMRRRFAAMWHQVSQDLEAELPPLARSAVAEGLHGS